MKKWHVLGAVVAIAGIALAYYAISPLFRNITVNEALPTGGTQGAHAQVVGTTGHPASGSARIVEADGKQYVRYENFKTINGPDIYVYLAKDLDAKEYVNLGKVRATEGDINYEIPAEVDVAAYPYVLTWCKTFSVLFNYADLSKAR